MIKKRCLTCFEHFVTDNINTKFCTDDCKDIYFLNITDDEVIEIDKSLGWIE